MLFGWRTTIYGVCSERAASIFATVSDRREYLLQIDAYATLAGPELPKLQVTLNGEPVKTRGKDHRGKRHNFILKLAGQGEPPHSIAYMNNYVNNDSPDLYFVAIATCRLVVQMIGPLDAPQLPESLARDRPLPNATEIRDVARESPNQFAKRRSPPGIGKGNQPAADVRRYVMADAGSFEQGMQLVVRVKFWFPPLLFRWELDTRPSGDEPIRELTDQAGFAAFLFHLE